ncbi:MAG: hypothetical protein JWN12_213 [Candidatus Saccharibacteria bacterium]|nr:hypothetical protein [Candidatus Saccharibacteria bacterium]
MNNPEGVLRVTSEFDHTVIPDVQYYETHRDEKIRDDYIAFAKLMRDAIVKGYSPDWIVIDMLDQLPVSGGDAKRMVEFINYFLQESGSSIQFDENFNAFTNGVEVVHTETTENFTNAKKIYVELQDDAAQRLAEIAVTMLMNGRGVRFVAGAVAGDVVEASLDNVLVAKYLNEYLEANGLPMRSDAYINLIEK